MLKSPFSRRTFASPRGALPTCIAAMVRSPRSAAAWPSRWPARRVTGPGARAAIAPRRGALGLGLQLVQAGIVVRRRSDAGRSDRGRSDAGRISCLSPKCRRTAQHHRHNEPDRFSAHPWYFLDFGHREKGDRHHLPERPGGCFAQMVPVPFPLTLDTNPIGETSPTSLKSGIGQSAVILDNLSNVGPFANDGDLWANYSYRVEWRTWAGSIAGSAHAGATSYLSTLALLGGVVSPGRRIVHCRGVDDCHAPRARGRSLPHRGRRGDHCLLPAGGTGQHVPELAGRLGAP